MIHKSAAKLRNDLRKIAEQFDVEVKDVVRKVVFDIHTTYVERTPKDTGRAAASWGISLEKDTTTVQPEGDYPNPLEAAKKLIRVPQTTRGNPGRFWIWNNVEYIDALEYGLYPGTGPKTINGFSRQAPTGILAVSQATIEYKIEAELQNVLRRRT